MHPEHRSIGELAYLLWQARGCPHGTAHEDWLEAERQLREAPAAARTEAAAQSRVVDDSLRDTFPASDPPASHRPDVPPANAEAKWKAAGAERKRPTRARAQSAKTDKSKPSNDALR